MKKLIPLSGGGGRAVLTVEQSAGGLLASAAPAVEGEIWLVGPGGELARPGARSGFEPGGALIIKDGALVMSGGFAGRRAMEQRALREILLRGPCPQRQGPADAPPVEAPKPPPQREADADGFIGRSEALFEILKKARELFDTDAAAQPAPPVDDDGAIANPFPDAFPLSRWRRVAYPGTERYYLEGETLKNGVEYIIHALPGEYRGGRRGRGFNSFYRARDGSGYWVRMTKKV